MNVIYVHGLDSSCHSVKGMKLMKYMQQHHPDIQVHRPDLNHPPQQAYDKLKNIVSELSRVLLVGSSLGGYFSTLIHNETGCSMCLLNPSTQPHLSLQRLFMDNKFSLDKMDDSVVGMQTTGGWSVTRGDLRWFDEHPLTTIKYPNKVSVLLKTADEVLNYEIAQRFYQKQNVKQLWIQQGGDHRILDFDDQLPTIVPWMVKTLQQGDK